MLSATGINFDCADFPFRLLVLELWTFLAKLVPSISTLFILIKFNLFEDLKSHALGVSMTQKALNACLILSCWTFNREFTLCSTLIMHYIDSFVSLLAWDSSDIATFLEIALISLLKVTLFAIAFLRNCIIAN